MRNFVHRRRFSRESGVTLIELSIAGVVLVVGMLSLMGLLMVAIGGNSRSKIDSSATMFSQAVLEQLSAKLAKGGPGTLTDNANCNGTGTTHVIAQGSGGAPLTAQGNINFTQAQVGGYAMNYVDCNNNVQTTYDIRWNVQDFGNNTYLVTVGARPTGAMPVQYSFSIPVNMRAYVGAN